MKKGLHPTNYRPVVFKDTSADFAFLTRSTAQTEETIVWQDGKEYPLVKVHISSASHPFYTGKKKLVDVAGRVDKFKARQEAAVKKRVPKQTAPQVKNKVSSKEKINKPSRPKDAQAELKELKKQLEAKTVDTVKEQ